MMEISYSQFDEDWDLIWGYGRQRLACLSIPSLEMSCLWLEYG